MMSFAVVVENLISSGGEMTGLSINESSNVLTKGKITSIEESFDIIQTLYKVNRNSDYD